MATTRNPVRTSVSLPAAIAAEVRTRAKTRRLSTNRILLDLIETGIEAEKRKQEEFFELAERLRSVEDPDEAKRLGHQMGRMIFGS